MTEVLDEQNNERKLFSILSHIWLHVQTKKFSVDFGDHNVFIQRFRHFNLTKDDIEKSFYILKDNHILSEVEGEFPEYSVEVGKNFNLESIESKEIGRNLMLWIKFDKEENLLIINDKYKSKNLKTYRDVLNFLFANDGTRLYKEDWKLDSNVSKWLDTEFSEIVKRLGIKNPMRKIFFPQTKNESIMLRSRVYRTDLEEIGLLDFELDTEMDKLGNWQLI